MILDVFIEKNVKKKKKNILMTIRFKPVSIDKIDHRQRTIRYSTGAWSSILLFYHKQWIQCISNVSKIGIFPQWKNIVFFH